MLKDLLEQRHKEFEEKCVMFGLDWPYSTFNDQTVIAVLEKVREEVGKRSAEYKDSSAYMKERGFDDISVCENKVAIVLNGVSDLLTSAISELEELKK